MDRRMYNEFANKLKERLIGEVNGWVTTEVFPDADILIVRIEFKEFKFSHLVQHIADNFYNSSSEAYVGEILDAYNRELHSCFFKTAAKKAREKEYAEL